MARFIRVQHIESGAIASIPEMARRHFPDYERVDGPAPEKPKSKKNLPSQPTHAAPAASTETE